MESMQAIRSRIQSISGTRQITQSMRLVSTAKVQKARAKMEESRPFSQEMERLVRRAAAALPPGRNPYFTGPAVEKAAVIVISSDRGLCGGYNINVGREGVSLVEKLGGARLVTVGAKVTDFCRRRGISVEKSFVGVSETPLFADAAEIGALALDWYRKGRASGIYLVYTQFHTLLHQTPVHVRLLPLEREEPEGDSSGPAGLTRFEPEEESFLEKVMPFYIHSRVFHAMLESSASEQSARITSMDAAVKNSDEMMEELSQRYNRARQGAITQEITEIVGGANALL